MQNLSDDDLNIEGASDEELARAWILWFRLAQYTNDLDPPYTHGVFAGLTHADLASVPPRSELDERPSDQSRSS